MSTNTYVALKQYTVSGSSTYAVTLDTIPTTGYSDLVLVMSIKCAVDTNQPYVQFNTDLGTSTTNYSTTVIRGDGSSATSGRHTNNFAWYPVPGPGVGTANNFHIWEMNIQNYSNATTYKTGLSRYNNASSIVTGNVHLWRQTAAINSITITSEGGSGAYFVAGTTFSLYGIANADVGAYATGGIITQDANYYYHAFGSSSTFTPTRNLTADILVVAGGGGAGAGGGGAGGVRAFSSQSLTNGTVYTCTVGAGGTAGADYSTRGGSGGNSSIAGTGFTTLNSTGGGGAGTKWASAPQNTGISGGSGGGGGPNDNGDGTINAGGTGNAGSYSPVEGYAGGSGRHQTPTYLAGGGGGGAGGVGVNAAASTVVAGGAGTNTYNSVNFSSWLSTTGLGVINTSDGLRYLGGGGGGAHYQSAYIGTATAGGGAATNTTVGTDGLATTGGGGGAGAWNGSTGGKGGSGLIIVRYAK